MTTKTKSFEWLRTALAVEGHRQKDLAEAWGVDDAVVSRFISTGEPELTWHRGNILARMVNMSLNELEARLAENIPPRSAGPSRANSHASAAPDGGNRVQNILDELSDCVERARKALPQAHISVRITFGES
jgi:hypothetical protein